VVEKQAKQNVLIEMTGLLVRYAKEYCEEPGVEQSFKAKVQRRVVQWKHAGVINQRSEVQILPLQPTK
jgi:hypothetical protein